MGTSAPVRRVIDVPFVVPRHEPLKLPAPDPERWVPIWSPAEPVRVPVEVERYEIR